MNHRYKCCFIGDYGVGKTSFIRSILGMPLKGVRTTLGIDFFTTSISVHNKTCTVTLWDTAGADRYRSLTHSYIRDSDVVFIMYSIMEMTAMESVERCFRELEGLNPRIVAVVGTKTDMGQRTHDVYGTIQPWARLDWDIITDVCTTKDNAATKKIFKRCMEMIVDTPTVKKGKSSPVRLISLKPKPKSCCT